MPGVIGRAVASAGAVLVLLGVPVGVASAGAGPAELAVTPTSYDFGQVLLEERPQRFTLANTGGRASSALTVSLSGSAEFTVIGNTCSGTSLGPSKRCTATVRFTPAAIRTVSATLTVADKKGTDRASVVLTGTGQGLGSPSPLSHLYWSNTSAGTINVGALTGAASTTLVSGLGEPHPLRPSTGADGRAPRGVYRRCRLDRGHPGRPRAGLAAERRGQKPRDLGRLV